MLQKRLAALAVLIVGCAIGWFVYASQTGGWRPFELGLDLSGGTRLVYSADTSKLAEGSDVGGAMDALRSTIERRIDAFGVAEPSVYTEQGGVTGQGGQRLVVELPGVTDTQEAIDLIGKTPVLDFRLETTTPGTTTPSFIATGLTGEYLSNAQLQFMNTTGSLANQPVVALTFNSKGKQLFATLTTNNVGHVIGIFLDGQPISTPTVQEPITDGQAIIQGSFTPEQAKTLAQDLNFGALPVPITLLSTQTIGSTLGSQAVADGIMAGIWGVLLVGIFMLLWYRLPGVVASVALILYIVAMLAVFKLIPVTLTAAGIAGFILSIGMAVDANILIFERTREELAAGKDTREAVKEGFARAWPSIRDSNFSSMITAIILYWFGTALVKGFALVFGIGVLVSMLTAISASRTLLVALGLDRRKRLARFLYSSGTKFRI
ncbi:MAG TPA: protein translocase subunit SecD [Candidatus Paceibacterota bacterium]|nr:protein translocase subunit SecD [Candidatus Paceibacterota bacterium]